MSARALVSQYRAPKIADATTGVQITVVVTFFDVAGARAETQEVPVVIAFGQVATTVEGAIVTAIVSAAAAAGYALARTDVLLPNYHYGS